MMINEEQMLVEVIGFVKGLAQNNFDGEITPDTKILSDHVIDSLGIIQLITFIESRFQVKMGQEELTVDNLDSARSIVNFIKGKRP